MTIRILCIFLLSLNFQARFALSLTEFDPTSPEPQWIPPSEVSKILFSQLSIHSIIQMGTPLEVMYEAMKANGWWADLPPIHIVQMRPGIFTSLDNRRLAAAQDAGIPVYAIVHQPTEKVPAAIRPMYFGAKTYATAVHNRIEAGKFEAGKGAKYLPGMIGVPRRDVKVIDVTLKEFKKSGSLTEGTWLNSLNISRDYVLAHGN